MRLWGIRKIAQQLRILVLTEDTGLVPESIWRSTMSITTVSGDPKPSSDLQGHKAHTHSVQTYMQAKQSYT